MFHWYFHHYWCYYNAYNIRYRVVYTRMHCCTIKLFHWRSLFLAPSLTVQYKTRTWVPTAETIVVSPPDSKTNSSHGTIEDLLKSPSTHRMTFPLVSWALSDLLFSVYLWHWASRWSSASNGTVRFSHCGRKSTAFSVVGSHSCIRHLQKKRRNNNDDFRMRKNIWMFSTILFPF